jgi:integration host factor subunit beta
MLKSALIHRISSQNPHLYQRDVEKVLNAILDQIVGALARGDRVELRDFGVFSTRLRKARTGRNPRTGVAVSVAQKEMTSFKASKELRKRLNPEAAQGD